MVTERVGLWPRTRSKNPQTEGTIRKESEMEAEMRIIPQTMKGVCKSGSEVS